MKLSLSVRIAEHADKKSIRLPVASLAELARTCGYHALCLRASVAGVHTPFSEMIALRARLDRLPLAVSMVTSDFDVPLNNERGPEALRHIEPHLKIAQALGASLLRVCLKTEEDIRWAQRACAVADEWGIRLVHQCHSTSLFETVDQSIEALKQVNRENFGLIYEPANLMLCAQPYGRDVLRRLAPWIMNVYVQNHRPSAQGRSAIETWVRGTVRFDPIALWETGGVDFSEVFAGLAEIGYLGYVTVHQAHDDLMEAHEVARRSQEFLRSLGNFEA